MIARKSGRIVNTIAVGRGRAPIDIRFVHLAGALASPVLPPGWVAQDRLQRRRLLPGVFDTDRLRGTAIGAAKA
ncbi:MAG: hypothetical protein IPI73_07580 [Betaproteobacteria bacterium]|nr:hypothetical protein [Betaproteobacteria bacterium]